MAAQDIICLLYTSCLKAGNAVILRGGKEAIHSNLAIAGVMREAVAQAGLPRDSVQLVEDTSCLLYTSRCV